MLQLPDLSPLFWPRKCDKLEDVLYNKFPYQLIIFFRALCVLLRRGNFQRYSDTDSRNTSLLSQVTCKIQLTTNIRKFRYIPKPVKNESFSSMWASEKR